MNSSNWKSEVGAPEPPPHRSKFRQTPAFRSQPNHVNHDYFPESSTTTTGQELPHPTLIVPTVAIIPATPAPPYNNYDQPHNGVHPYQTAADNRQDAYGFPSTSTAWNPTAELHPAHANPELDDQWRQGSNPSMVELSSAQVSDAEVIEEVIEVLN